MADVKISELIESDILVGTETLPIVQSGATKKVSVNQIVTKVDSYTKAESDSALGAKVDKVTGKGLSANDLTDTLLTLLNLKKVKNVTTDAVNNWLVITYTDDTTSNLTISDIVTDVNVTGATLNATSNVLTLTSDDGGADVTIDLSDFVNSSELNNALAGKQDKLLEGAFVNGDKTKLDGIEDGATADQTKTDIDALGINASTVNGKTVETNVPSGAIFTDTVYDDSSVLKYSDTVSAVTTENKLMTQDDVASLGGGDMLKSTYDTNSSGIVDNAETINSLTVETAVPSNALFTDTVYDDTSIQATVANKQDILSEGAFVNGDKIKLDGVELGATADQTDLEIKTAYENNANTNNYTDAEKTKLAGLESSHFKGEFASLSALQTAYPTASAGDYANVDTGVGSDVERYVYDDSDSSWILQTGTSTSLTDAQIKTQYENNADTNAYTDSEKVKLASTEISSQLDSRDTANRARANHTGTQVASTISDFASAVQSAETVTSLSLATNILSFTDENGTTTNIDLSLYLDDTNLARLTSGTINGATGIATFTRDDASTFTIDMSALLDDTTVTVNDTLTSTSTTEALSANQGKVLNDTKIAATNYATATVGGTIKVRLSGTDLFISTDGTNP